MNTSQMNDRYVDNGYIDNSYADTCVNQSTSTRSFADTATHANTGMQTSASFTNTAPTAANVLEIEYCGPMQQVDADIVIPVYNEQEQIADSVRTLMNFLRTSLPFGWAFTWNIVIADNASTDATWDIARQLSHDYPRYVRAIHLNQKGRGRALKVAWNQSLAKVQAYMDVDLSTDIKFTPQLVNLILYGQSDVVIGSRLLDQSQVLRSAKREFISRTYNQMLQAWLGAEFSDAQCGFKAISRSARDVLLPKIVDNEWFFDTELLLQTQIQGLRLTELPVVWVEDAGSTVHIADTVIKDLRGMKRMYPQLIAHYKAQQLKELQQLQVVQDVQTLQSGQAVQSSQSSQTLHRSQHSSTFTDGVRKRNRFTNRLTDGLSSQQTYQPATQTASQSASVSVASVVVPK